MINRYKTFNKTTRGKMAMYDQNPSLEAMHWGHCRAFCETVNETAMYLMNMLCLENANAQFEGLVSKAYHEWKNEHLLDGISLDYETFLEDYRKAVCAQIHKDLYRE